MLCRGLALLSSALMLVACASHDPKDGPYTPTAAGGTDQSQTHSYNGLFGDPIMATIGIALSLEKLNANDPKNEKLHGIHGKCRVRVKGDGKFPSGLCQDTYLIARHLKTGHETKVWVDGSGEFSIMVGDNEQYSLSAFNEQHWIKSDSITARAPCFVELEIGN